MALTKFDLISLIFFKVDGQDISTMKHMNAVNVLRATKQFVKLVVLRRPTGVRYNAIYLLITFAQLIVLHKN